jgi:hypothetical protein
MGIDMFVLRHISWILRIVIQFELYFGRGQCQGSFLIPIILQCSGYFKKSSQRYGQWRLIIWVVHHILGLVISQRSS